MFDRIVFVGLCVYVLAQESPPVPGTNLVEPRPPRPCPLEHIYARCDMVANPNKPSNINGTIYFKQEVYDTRCMYSRLNIQVVIDNVPINDGTDNHGLHVHQYGDMSGGCETMRGHLNPYKTNHGGLWNKQSERHLGDLGNVQQRPSGNINMRIVDYLGTLHGYNSIAGRGLVLHAAEDDLGRNTNSAESLKTGNAGARLACCVIKYTTAHPQGVFTLYK